MNMQDNEFDDLFRSKLDGLEMEPSAQVWDSIDTELNGKKRKLGILPILSMAASVIILIAAGILFIPGKESIVKKPHGKNEMVQAQKVNPATVKPAINDTVTAPTTGSKNMASVQVPVTHISKTVAAEKPEVNSTPEQQNAPVIAKTEPVKIEEQPVLASASPKLTQDKKDVVPGIETPLAVKQNSVDAASNPSSEPVLAAVQLPAANNLTKPVTKRHGIHNMGDLINLVVAKVDKRKDKLIQFTDDDDESTITGVHIGAIDIKKEAK